MYLGSMETREKVITSFAVLKAALAIPSELLEEKGVPSMRHEKLGSTAGVGVRNFWPGRLGRQSTAGRRKEKRERSKKRVVSRITKVF